MNDDQMAIDRDDAEDNLIREAMRALGKRKSERKTLSCRANAKLPRKRTVSKPLATALPSAAIDAK